MADNIGGFGGGDGSSIHKIGAKRLEALRKLQGQRDDLVNTEMPADLKQIRDGYLKGLERPGWVRPGGDDPLLKPAPIELRPKYGMAPIPDERPAPIELRPKYGMAPIPDDFPVDVAPMYGMAPIVDEGPIDAVPMYGASPIIDELPIDIAPMYGMAPIFDQDEEPAPIEIRPKYGMAPILRDDDG